MHDNVDLEALYQNYEKHGSGVQALGWCQYGHLFSPTEMPHIY